MMKIGKASSLHCGITLIELLIALSLVCLVLSLTIPAILQARETGRRVSCMNNLHQISLAVHAYEASYMCFPQSQNSNGGFLVNILPFLEQQELATELQQNLQTSVSPKDFVARLPVYLCSSDSATVLLGDTGPAGSNYCGNSGSWAEVSTAFDSIFCPLFDYGFGGGVVRVRDVTDGLSNTDCLCEQLRADLTPARLRTVWNTPKNYSDYKAFAFDCSSIPQRPTDFGWQGHSGIKGTPWVNGSVMLTTYNHVCVPNSPSCFNGAAAPAGAATVSSNHADVVNLVFADGHAQGVSSQIDSATWFSWGSRNGGAGPIVGSVTSFGR